MPLAAGDWPLIPKEQLHAWFPWPTVWWPEVGFGLKNFSGVYEVPIEAIGALLSLGSADWGIVEKILYFIPFAILSFVAPWILAREILRSPAWALLSALIFATNTYFVTFSAGGQMYLAVAEALAPLVFFALIRSLRLLSMRWALATGLLMGLQAAYEVRVSYLTVILCVLYAIVLVTVEALQRHVAQRALLLVTALFVLAGTQLYWLVPLITFKGNAGLPIAPAPWVAFMQLANGIAGVAPYWTGAVPAIFQRVPVNPAFFLFPLIAFLALNMRRISAELLWLCFSALAAAFLIKQTNPPAGEVYHWMFTHVPGWNLFREGSKFYFVIAIAYAVLIPSVLRGWLGFKAKARVVRFASRVLAIFALLAIGALAAGNLIPLERGQIGYTTQPIERPLAVRQLDDLLTRDNTYGAVLWIAGAWFTNRSGPDPQFVSDHNFVTRSVRHPVVELLGTQDSGDPLTAFCRSPTSGFCYLDNGLLPFLVRQTGARYVVAPASSKVGRIEVANSNYADILVRLRSALGNPQLLGDSDHTLAVWKMDVQTNPIVSSPAIAVVNGSPRATEDSLPALLALGIPVVFSRDVNGTFSPGLAASTIQVAPRVDGACAVQSGNEYVLLASSAKRSLPVHIGPASLALPFVGQASRAPGWSAYGPVFLDSGRQVISTEGTTLGPCVAWSQQTDAVMTGQISVQNIDPGLLTAEHVVSPPSPAGLNWVELRRTFDPAWQLNSAEAHLVGDGLFNLYFVPAKAAALDFSFTTREWEALGVALSLLVLLAVLAGYLASGRLLWKRSTSRQGGGSLPPVGSHAGSFVSAGAQGLAQAGIVVLVIASLFQAIGWYSGSTAANELVTLSLNTNPYAKATYFIAAAMLLLALSAVLHVIRSGLTLENDTDTSRATRPQGDHLRSSTHQPIRQVAKALLSSYRKPETIYNYVSLHTALRVDQLMRKTPTYSPIDWSTALGDLDRLLAQSAAFLSEPEVKQLESHVRQKTASLAGGGPWALALNTDLALARCLYLVCRALAPAIVVETGVAYGLSSAFILQALALNNSGSLHSIDLPLPGTDAFGSLGALVPAGLRDRWHLHLGPSQRELPKILAAGPVGVFVHDSLHTYRNMVREFLTVWPQLAPGGVLVSDDVEGNNAFKELLLERPQYWEVIKKEGKTDSLFGVAIKGRP